MSLQFLLVFGSRVSFFDGFQCPVDGCSTAIAILMLLQDEMSAFLLLCHLEPEILSSL